MATIHNFLTETKLIEIFISIDDFMLLLIKNKLIGSLLDDHKGLNYSEIMTILIGYHLSGYKCFKYYYIDCIRKKLRTYFPKAPGYERFIQIQYDVLVPLSLFLQLVCYKQATRANYIDSTPLAICHNKRIPQNKVFKGKAKKGHSSMGMFYGFKLHVAVNQNGELIYCAFTTGNIADNNQNILYTFAEILKGKCFGDKGYLTKLKEDLKNTGFQLITKQRANMKKQNLSKEDAYYLRHRGIIESVFDTLKCFCEIEHTRYRNPKTMLSNVLTGLIAYSFCDNKPKIMPFVNRISLANEISIAA